MLLLTLLLLLLVVLEQTQIGRAVPVESVMQIVPEAVRPVHAILAGPSTGRRLRCCYCCLLAIALSGVVVTSPNAGEAVGNGRWRHCRRCRGGCRYRCRCKGQICCC
ncbi:uncharacterized protein BDZ83DRAFT_605893 [Colletotrichum acutatum]|uniref:Secreted protein n=1 Tax=Glomerella acutata TaxID=27357 RepID=A0AAD9D0A3_GLOAC|nr:uncharacterized protein BDZ83DRAFT_605893 [Colletotrichum acutatum]KAK1729250.1 hypothetical protein BDZ83DRAFT_605893 [Colletotrichum acutatum]